MRKIFTISFPLFMLFIAIGEIWGQETGDDPTTPEEGDEETTVITFEHDKGRLDDETFNDNVILSTYYDYTAQELQQTHEYTKTVYVKKGKKKELRPFAYSPSYNNTYYRWFMYHTEDDTDSLDTYLDLKDLKRTVTTETENPDGTTTSETTQEPIYYKSDHGYITNWINAGAAAFPDFIVSEESEIPDNGIQIALDISCSNDVNTINLDLSTATEVNEPTLAYRYIFDIRDAEDLMNEITTDNTAYINKVRKEVFATANMFFQVLLTHPLNDYYINEKGYLDRNDITITATRTYTENGETKAEELTGLSATSGKIYIHSNNTMLVIPQPEVGVYTVKLSCGDTQLDEYRITFLSIHSAGMYKEDDLGMNTGKFGHLSQDSLDLLVTRNRAKLLGSIDFDQKEEDGNEEFYYLDNLNNSNYYPYPILPWTQSSYAWMEGANRSLDFASYRIITTSDNAPYKSALTYVLGSGEKVFGHGDEVTAAGQDAYMYVNVANEPGKMLELEWDDEICPNSRLYLTFWINEFSYGESGNVEISVTGIKKNTGERENLRTYITGYVPKYIANYSSNAVTYNSSQSSTYEYQHPLYNNGTDTPEDCRGHWMQVCYSFITEFDPEDYESFVLTLNNNTKNSQGGDFGIDDIRVYAVNPTVIAQETKQCDDVYEVDIRLPYEQLAYTYAADPGQKDGYFSFWKQESGSWVPVHYNYNNGDDELTENENYGSFSFNTEYDQNPEEGEQDAGKMYQWEDAGGERYLVFNTVPSIEVLNPDEDYIVVFYSDESTAENWIEREQTLNFEDPCLVYSYFRVHKSQVVLIDGQPSTDTWKVCYSDKDAIFEPVMQVSSSEQGDADNNYYSGEYDIYIGSKDEFETSYEEALNHFRADFPEAEDPSEVTIKTEENAQFTEDNKTTLTNAKDKFIFKCSQIRLGDLIGDASSESANEDIQLTIVPIIPAELADDAENTVYCWAPYEFTLEVEGDAPETQIGFYDVEYYDYVPNVRAGLTDLEETDSKTLTIPLRNLVDDKTVIKTESNDGVYLDIADLDGVAPTDDPTVFAYLEEQDINDPFGDRVYVGNVQSLSASQNGGDANTLVVKFDRLAHDDVEISLKEGYYYRFRVKYKEEDIEEGTGCDANLFFVVKIIPKYQKWTGNATDDWNNDNNWVRSTKAELRKADGDAYVDDEKASGYAPMYFTYITIPEEGQVEQYNEGTIEGQEGTTHPILKLRDDATDNIEYDMMVEPNNDEDGYHCIPYYMNHVNQIHFEPNAEMLHAELLDYEKAWVDYKLTSGQWYTLASPLQGVVAGDFYTDSETGTEEQEYFTPITFVDNKNDGANSDNDDSENSRFQPSVYQRGWNKDAKMISVGETEGTSLAIQGNWSAVYNNVYEAYNPGKGFSIKVLDMPKNSNTEAIFRLPKNDDSYSYYDSEGNETEASTSSITREGAGKLKITTPEENAEKDVLFTVTDLEANGNYYLVGNPFMAYLDTKKFFEANSRLGSSYWYVEDDVQNIVSVADDQLFSTDKGINIPPLHSFFVRKVDDTSPITITFKNDMQVLGETSNEETNANALILTVQTEDGKTSHAAIAYDMSADKDYAADEDAELFLDSNLSDVPAIYTVAGTMATSINRTSELYNIPIGIYGNSTEMVTLSFEGLKHFSSARRRRRRSARARR